MCHKSYPTNHLIFRIIFIIFQITKEFLGTQKPHIKCGFVQLNIKLQLCRHVINRLLNGGQLIRVFIRNGDAKLIFKSHHKFNQV